MPWLTLHVGSGIKEKTMPPFPLGLEDLLGKVGMYLVFLGIGFLFGFVFGLARCFVWLSQFFV